MHWQDTINVAGQFSPRLFYRRIQLTVQGTRVINSLNNQNSSPVNMSVRSCIRIAAVALFNQRINTMYRTSLVDTCRYLCEPFFFTDRKRFMRPLLQKITFWHLFGELINASHIQLETTNAFFEFVVQRSKRCQDIFLCQ